MKAAINAKILIVVKSFGIGESCLIKSHVDFIKSPPEK